MDIIQAIILGIVQGLTEFLPVSSSGHLFLLPQLLGWQPAGLTFDVALHLGSLVAVIIFFGKDLWQLFLGFLRACTSPKTIRTNHHSRMSIYLFLAMIPAGLCGLLLDDIIETTLRNPWITVSMLISIGIIFLLIEQLVTPKKGYEGITFKDAMWIGIFQCLALIPGVSRSGITMLTALVLGVRHQAAAKFSFLLGTPLIAAAGMLKLKDLLATGVTQEMLLYFATGMIAAAISGYLCIRFFLAFLQKHSFRPFGWYRIAFGVAVSCWLLLA